ncbi:hypothetical protein LU276_06570 [Moraxella haemolytica]|uniref:hypothetical protein n=1 Tax=Moraxella haemolytica TaxID=2904119 RepID=UPI00254298EE|nr:hypothetical protein [Moraxella sp. ZY171148]WII94688.1 hypothetical protein LU276_06570 [Moraxella sp. ZY171148]
MAKSPTKQVVYAAPSPLFRHALHHPTHTTTAPILPCNQSERLKNRRRRGQPHGSLSATKNKTASMGGLVVERRGLLIEGLVVGK